MSLLTAIATAAVFALFGFPFRFYLCWFSFSRLGTALGTTLYVVLAGGGGGLLGWGIASLSRAQLTHSEALNGVLYGIGGALALRADFRARPKSAVVPTDQFKDARSALTISINWTSELLDEITYRNAETWLSGLPSDQLCAQALRTESHIKNDQKVNDRAKAKLFAILIPAMEMLNNPADMLAGRAHLVAFCASYYRNEHLPRLARTQIPDPAGAPTA